MGFAVGVCYNLFLLALSLGYIYEAFVVPSGDAYTMKQSFAGMRKIVIGYITIFVINQCCRVLNIESFDFNASRSESSYAACRRW